MPAPFTTPVAISVPFEPNRNPQWGGNPGPSGIESLNVQDAIEEAKADALANDRFVVLPQYNGNANTGRYLEIWNGLSSFDAPLFLSAAARILTATVQTTAVNATCTIGIFDINVSTIVPVYTIVMTAQKRVEYVGTPLATFLPDALLAFRVTGGSISSPSMQITLSAST